MVKEYKAKVSLGMLIALFLLFFAPIFIGIIRNGINQEFYALLGILIPTYAFILYMFLNTKYIIEDTTLIVKCGFIYNKAIDIRQINKISQTNSLISSPAPSFDRIELKYGKFDEIIISPQDKLNFSNDLTLINSEIHNDLTKN